jgi:hypothetical protein
MNPAAPAQSNVISHAEVRLLCGDILDWKVAAIIATGSSIEEIEEAVAYAAGEDDVMGEERRPLSGRVAEVYDVLVADDEPDER